MTLKVASALDRSLCMVLGRTMNTLRMLLGFVVLCLGLAGCGRSQEEGLIRIWSHQGQEAENQAMRDIVNAFNEAHVDDGIRVTIDFFPDYQYTERISIAAAAGDLPDAFGLDGPTVAQFVDAGVLAPIHSYFEEDDLADFLDTILSQGTIDGILYALGSFDSAMVIYYDRDSFDQAGVVPPASGTAWSWDEFDDACAQLQSAGFLPISLHMDVTADEWYTYAFSPLIWSVGGRLIDTDRNQVEGILNAPENVAALERWQALFEAGYAARSPVNPDPFGSGESAMDWNGHWMARSHMAALGDRLGVMPLPRTGDIAASPSGSWCWGISAFSDRPDLAARWLRWVTDPATGIQPIVAAGGAIPARHSAFQLFPEYEEDPFRLFKSQLIESGRSRPQTPFYGNLTQHFAAALRDIAQGANVQDRLDISARAVQRIVDRR